MTDYIPNPPNPHRDPRNYDDRYYEPASGTKGLTLLVGILVAIALVAGLMFFTGPRDRSTDVAQQPTLNAPVDQSRTPAIPARPVEPAPPAATPATPAAPQQ
jgi:hypothetical protein